VDGGESMQIDICPNMEIGVLIGENLGAWQYLLNE